MYLIYCTFLFIRVVTGARLVVEDNTILIQIQLGNLMANGIIDASTVDWQPVDTGEREEIRWEGIRSIDLTSMDLPTDKVVIGMQFRKSPGDANRIQLNLFSCKFNFKTGGLSECRGEENNKHPQ